MTMTNLPPESLPADAPLADALATPAPLQDPAPETPGRLEVTGQWRRVSPRSITVELIGWGITLVVVAAAAALLAFLTGGVWPWVIAGALALAVVVTAAFVPRRIRSIGYLLRDDDLLFRRGIMWQRFVAVPYGRMQLVDINRGPVARALGLAELKFVTASPATGVTIPGLPLDEAESLRDHLVSVAESRRTGL
jgi:membrane protein YdbS with pleckstrin-like domain